MDDCGYHVIEAADGPTAQKILQSNVDIDLLITDFGLPGGMNGRQVAEIAKQARPGLKVLVITGFADNAASGNGHVIASMPMLTKPFTIEALANKVRQLLPGESGSETGA
jgi:DNA-binding response OmpR family regulator